MSAMAKGRGGGVVDGGVVEGGVVDASLYHTVSIFIASCE